MKELDTLQQNLNLKLRSSNARNDAGLSQKEKSVVEQPSHLALSGAGAASSLEALETLRSENTDDGGFGLERELPRTEFGDTDVRHEMTSPSGEATSIPDVGHLLSSWSSPREWNKAHDLQNHDQTNEKTNDAMRDREAGVSKNTFPFDKSKDEHLQHNAEGDSFFSLEKNSSSAGDRRPSVDSELSISDISGEFSVSGYVQDNSKPTQFTDIKDSWLSSEEEDSTTNVGHSEKPGLSSSPSAFNADSERVGLLNSATESKLHHRKADVDSDYNNSGDSDGDNSSGQKDFPVTGIQIDEQDSLEGSTENHGFNKGLTADRAAGLLNGISDGEVKGFATDQENQHNSYASYDTVQSRELPRQPPLLDYHDTCQLTSATLPNFFMPSEQLAESMKALRLGSSHHKASSSHSKLLARSKQLQRDQQTKGKLADRFAKREPVYKARRDERPPISSTEADRIARIFNSGSV